MSIVIQGFYGASAGSGAGVTDHGALAGLADDDHAHYHTNARGDARYAALAHAHAELALAATAIQPGTVQSFSAIQTFAAGLAGGSNIIADAGDAQTILLDGRVHVLTLTEPCAITITPTGSAYSFALIVLIQNGAGGYDVTYTNSPKPMDTQALNTAATKHSAFVLWTPDGGTTYYRNGAGAET
ncbi:hypothetical protein [Thiocystis violascens]|uniref:hypothetical protein n=1 Tax=Thiocystis violascens TaxID=73141 RepID=UPI00022C1CBA|nr:hypothetical protein [Thiocystis violascens]